MCKCLGSMSIRRAKEQGQILGGRSKKMGEIRLEISSKKTTCFKHNVVLIMT